MNKKFTLPRLTIVQSIMNCPNCGSTEHEPMAKFCHICGASLIKSEKKITTQIVGTTQKNRTIRATRFTEAGCFSEGLAMVRINGKVGFIDKTGRIAIQPKFLMAGDSNYKVPYCPYHDGFSEGLTCASVGEYPNIYYGCINHTGEFVVPPRYDIIGTFHDGLAPFFRDGKWGYLNIRGVEVIPPVYQQAEEFSDGMAVVEIRTNQFVYIDKTGRVVLEKTSNRLLNWDNDAFPLKRATFNRAQDFHDGWARVECSRVLGYIDRDGHFTKMKFDNIDDFQEGLAWFTTDNFTKCGYIDRSLNVVIAPQFDEALPFQSGLAAVRQGMTWGYIDKTGHWVIPRQYDKALPFQEDLAAVVINEQYGFIDRSGTMVIPPRFSNVLPFSEGLAAVEINHEWGFIDKKGNNAF